MSARAAMTSTDPAAMAAIRLPVERDTAGEGLTDAERVVVGAASGRRVATVTAATGLRADWLLRGRCACGLADVRRPCGFGARTDFSAASADT